MTASTRRARTQSARVDALSRQVVEYVRDMGLHVGDHLAAQTLADTLGVSRPTANMALERLAETGLFRREPRRGFYLAKEPDADIAPMRRTSDDPTGLLYHRIADDRINGALPKSVSEAFLRKRYDAPPALIKAVIARILAEGWIQPRRGYGWTFSDALTSADALIQTYRLRMAIEPVMLLEPTFHIDQRTLDRLETVEKRMLDGEIETAPIDWLYEAGVIFHETLAKASGNIYMLDCLQRVSKIRRLLAYRSMVDRSRYYRQASEHLDIIALLKQGYQNEASIAMRHHICSVMVKMKQMAPILNIPPSRDPDPDKE